MRLVRSYRTWPERTLCTKSKETQIFDHFEYSIFPSRRCGYFKLIFLPFLVFRFVFFFFWFRKDRFSSSTHIYRSLINCKQMRALQFQLIRAKTICFRYVCEKTVSIHNDRTMGWIVVTMEKKKKTIVSNWSMNIERRKRIICATDSAVTFRVLAMAIWRFYFCVSIKIDCVRKWCDDKRNN